MSARQRERVRKEEELRKQLAILRASQQENEEDFSPKPAQKPPNRKFVLAESSSSSSESDSDDKSGCEKEVTVDSTLNSSVHSEKRVLDQPVQLPTRAEELVDDQENDGEEEDEEDLIIQPKRPTFVFESASSSSSSSSSDSEQEDKHASLNVVESANSNQHFRGTARRRGGKKVSTITTKNKQELVTLDEDVASETMATSLTTEVKEDLEMEMLDKILAEQAEQHQQNSPFHDQNLHMSNRYHTLSKISLEDIDTRQLDLDALIRMRFGAQQGGGAPGGDGDGGFFLPHNQLPGRANNRRGHQQNRASSSSLLHRKFVLGECKEDWTKPPSYIAGGIGMRKKVISLVENLSGNITEDNDNNHSNHSNLTKGSAKHRKSQKRHQHHHTSSSSSSSSHIQSTFSQIDKETCLLYTFEYSKDYQLLHENGYEVIQELHDPNLLVMFLANSSYFVQGFLDVSQIFLRMGHLDKAQDCLRRCLYIHECTFLDGFLPNNHLNNHKNNNQAVMAVMNPWSSANSTFFQALFQYALIVQMQGYTKLSCDLIRWMISLNPNDSMCQLFLHVDYLLIMTGKFESIFELCGLICPWTAGSVQESMVENWILTGGSDRNNNHDDSSCTSTSTDIHQQGERRLQLQQILIQILLGHNVSEEGNEDHWAAAYVLDSMEIHVDGGSGNDDDSPPEVVTYSLKHLPNWWFSLAVASYLYQEKINQQYRFNHNNPSNENEPSQSWLIRYLFSPSLSQDRQIDIPTLLLKKAIKKWPFVAEMLLEKLNSSSSGVLGLLRQSDLLQEMKTR